MSRTKRKKIKDGKLLTSIGDAQVEHNWRGRKMTPYAVTPAVFKDRATKTDHVPGKAKGVSKYDKLLSRNANRSLKKGMRQKLKKEIKEAYENT